MCACVCVMSYNWPTQFKDGKEMFIDMRCYVWFNDFLLQLLPKTFINTPYECNLSKYELRPIFNYFTVNSTDLNYLTGPFPS